MKIKIPKPNQVGNIVLDLDCNLVIVGANGSGKSRFGSYIEQHLSENVKRISAQRVLRVQSAPKANMEQAFNELINSHRHQPIHTQQDDYQIVLSAIFAETARRDSDFVKAAKESIKKIPVPLSVIDNLILVWNEVFHHRKIILHDGGVAVKADNSDLYPGNEMSDGEKIALYLMAQCLVLPPNYLIIIDEPELHLHKSLMNRLWNKIEEVRSDCYFIYITHDLDFATSRLNAEKIWIKSFHNNMWDWCYIPIEESLPEPLLLEVLGSNKPILFVEGEKGSLDFSLYQAYYDGFTVIPRGSCEKVIEAVKGFKNNSDLHSLDVCGLIDRDNRSKKEIVSLAKISVHVLEFSEIENVFLLPELISLVCVQLEIEDKAVIFEKIKKTIIDLFRNDMELILLKKIQSTIYHKSIMSLGAKAKHFEELKDKIVTISETIAAEYEQEKCLLETTISSGDYLEILKKYNNKGLCALVSHHFGLAVKGHAYQKMILRMLNGRKKIQLIEILNKYLPLIAASGKKSFVSNSKIENPDFVD